MIFWGEGESSRREFPISVKKIEWISAAGKDVMLYLSSKKSIKISYCRKCKTKLIWGDGTYNFDHKDNNAKNNSQKNCFLVCRNCHGKATRIGKIAVRDAFGGVSGYKTIKRKVSYKKPITKSKTSIAKAKKTISRKTASRSKTRTVSRRTSKAQK